MQRDAQVPRFLSSPFREWLVLNLSKNRRSGEEVDWKEQFAISLWWLWRWRNDQNFDNKVVLVERKISLVHGYCKDVQSAFRIQDIALGSHMRVVTFSVGWRPPSSRCFNFNTDGCWRAQDNVAGGGWGPNRSTWRLAMGF